MALFQLLCGAQKYDWGKVGSASSVARFASSSDPNFTIGESTPYAELWMGTHPSVMSVDYKTHESLHEILSADHSLIGTSVATEFDGYADLPFLFKVLSIEKVLSLQAHPDKKLAKILHEKDPKNYPDSNHKPEMAIALTDFEGFCGFRPVSEIKHFLDAVPEFRELVGEAAASKFANAIDLPKSKDDEQANKKLLQLLLGAVMTAPDDSVKSHAATLVDRVKCEGDKFVGGGALTDLLLRLNKQFPLDIGLFFGIFMLNYVTLSPGEAIFLKAKDPHAYISGDIIECMAASDNVVRAGFTPKFKDVDNLVAMLTYECAPVEQQKMKPAAFGRASGTGTAQLYDPPIPEFAVLRTAVTVGQKETVKGLDGPGIIVVTEGTGTIKAGSQSLPAQAGFVYFVGAGTEVEYVGQTGSLVSYCAFCET
ncbi:mannose-6-phosphate isomerase [Lipomyces arxii]|uniref:mannose-6-phosphate isomerase n=1 Tax=Lipomyces arxii TaxID=56418 RepID=UPI0034CFC7EA